RAAAWSSWSAPKMRKSIAQAPCASDLRYIAWMPRPSPVTDEVRRLLDTEERHAWSMDELFQATRSSLGSADYSSVFRAVSVLEKQGVVDKIDLGDGRARFELREDHHEPIRSDRVAGNGFRHQRVGVRLLRLDLLIETFLADLERVSAQLRELFHQRHHLGVELLARHRSVDQTPALRGGGIDEATCEQHLQRVLAAEVPRHRDTRRGAKQSVLHARRREAAVVACDREIARRDKLTARGRRDSMGRGDDGNRNRLHLGHELVAEREQLTLLVERLIEHLLEVVARRKRAAGAF